MFSRLSQSQSIINSPISGQNVQSSGNSSQIQIGNQSSQNTLQISLREVIDLLTEVEKMIQASHLPIEDKNKVGAYINVTKLEVQESNPDKSLAANNLKKVSETIKSANDTVLNTKQLWTNLQPLLLQIGEWLDVPKNFFGF
ncbi:MAG: hypothetical protein NW214_02530 [Pseudanabaenaceae cyanobacterium bins.39]|nr:hypothetical protein [Pseudanabaenaceae cyanobacterium bins.39]